MAQASALLPDLAPGDRALTVEEWFALPDDGRQYELYEGRLLLVASPTRSHQDALGNIFVAFKLFTREAGGYVGIAPLGVALSQFVGFEPDLVYVVAGREDVLTERGVEGVPDIVVEVLSPSTSAFDRGTKLRTYRDHGVREVWLVDLDARTVGVVTADGESHTRFGEPIPSRIVGIGPAGLS
jgi:Uma2 family endonuclease